MPKLIDAAALFAPANPQLATQLLGGALALQPLLWEQLRGMVLPLVDNLKELQVKGGDFAEGLIGITELGRGRKSVGPMGERTGGGGPASQLRFESYSKGLQAEGG